MSAYYLVSLGFFGGFGVGGVFVLCLWRRAHPEDFGLSTPTTKDDGAD